MTQGLAFVSIPILTRLLDPDDYGVLSVFTAFVAVFSILLGLNFHGAVSRKYYEKDGTFGPFLFTSHQFIRLAGLGGLLIFGFVVAPLGEFFEVPWIVVLAGLMVSYFTITFNIYLAYLQASLQSRRYAWFSFAQALGILVLGITMILCMDNNRYLGKIAAQTIVGAFFAVLAWRQLRKVWTRQWDWRYVRYALQLGIPLIPHTLSTFILASSDRIIINQLETSWKTGLYSLAYAVGSLILVFITAANNAWVPIFFQHLNAGEHASIQKKSDAYAILVVTLAFLISLFSKEVVMVLASPAYFEALALVPVITLGSVFIFLYQMCVNYTFYLKRNIWISVNTLICGSLNIALNYLFIPRRGYQAAAWTTLASFILLFILNYITARRLMAGKVMGFVFKFVILILSILLYVIYFSSNSSDLVWWKDFCIRVLFFILFLILLFIIWRKNIRSNRNSGVNI